ncbi:DinB family protein [Lysinibacillus sp. NPDC097231]|uniref:DinB family protein n=1 Tax=Lysinibacillus sp. NPDC097231 TaxID=3364142 RepID=UPI00382C7DE6
MKQRHKILFQQLKSYRNEVLQVLETVTKEEAEVIPTGFHNNIRWNMGHIYLDQFLWIETLTKEKNADLLPYQSWFGYGTSPANFNEETPSFEELKELLKAQPRQLKKTYGGRIKEKFPPIDMGMQTIEQVLIRTIFHEGMHLQTIIDIKKFL